jgi:hypothetical protein
LRGEGVEAAPESDVLRRRNGCGGGRVNEKGKEKEEREKTHAGQTR